MGSALLVTLATPSDASAKVRTQVSTGSRKINPYNNTFPAAGAQFGNFIAGTGSGLAGRTCQGAMDDPNTDYHFKIAFNTDGAPARYAPTRPTS
jgi:hypothetical protein